MNRIILVGHAASGKDFARKELQKQGFIYQLGYTTRPPRIGEIDGVDYHFISEELFNVMISTGKMYEHVQFNGWYYGTSKEQFFQENSVFIMTPTGISHIKEEDLKDCIIFYFNIDDSIRKERLENRNDNSDSIIRRMEADRNDFKDFKNYTVAISEPEFTVNYIKMLIKVFSDDRFRTI